MRRFDLWSMIARAPEGEGAAGGETLLTGGPDASVLFPGEKAEGGADVAAGGEGGEAQQQGDDQKAEAEKPADPADVVPEDGKYALTMPDGVEIDTDLAEALGPEFKDLGLTNAQAQKLVDKYISIQQSRFEANAKSPVGMVAAVMGEYFKEAGTPDTWMGKAKNDPVIGGANWATTEANAMRFMKHANDPALVAFLNASGGGNHPALIAAFAKAGALIREDSPASGGAGGAGKPAEAAYTLFPTDAPKG